MKKFKSVVATAMVFALVMGNTGLFRVEFPGKGKGIVRAIYVNTHDPKPGLSLHELIPEAFLHDPRPGAFKSDF